MRQNIGGCIGGIFFWGFVIACFGVAIYVMTHS